MSLLMFHSGNVPFTLNGDDMKIARILLPTVQGGTFNLTANKVEDLKAIFEDDTIEGLMVEDTSNFTVGSYNIVNQRAISGYMRKESDCKRFFFLGYYDSENPSNYTSGYITRDGTRFLMELSITNAGKIYLTSVVETNH